VKKRDQLLIGSVNDEEIRFLLCACRVERDVEKN